METLHTPKNWIGVVSAEHVRRGRAGGFMQVCHGKAAPLRRLRPGDRMAYYSPTISFRGRDRYQHFTAFGIVTAHEPYQVEMGGGFCPFRRDVDWLSTQEVPIAPLLDQLDFTAGIRNWGYQLRFGLFAVSDHDIALIASAMGVGVGTLNDEAVTGISLSPTVIARSGATRQSI